MTDSESAYAQRHSDNEASSTPNSAGAQPTPDAVVKNNALIPLTAAQCRNIKLQMVEGDEFRVVWKSKVAGHAEESIRTWTGIVKSTDGGNVHVTFPADKHANRNKRFFPNCGNITYYEVTLLNRVNGAYDPDVDISAVDMSIIDKDDSPPAKAPCVTSSTPDVTSARKRERRKGSEDQSRISEQPGRKGATPVQVFGSARASRREREMPALPAAVDPTVQPTRLVF
jgi:hypothetical protein